MTYIHTCTYTEFPEIAAWDEGVTDYDLSQSLRFTFAKPLSRETIPIYALTGTSECPFPACLTTLGFVCLVFKKQGLEGRNNFTHTGSQWKCSLWQCLETREDIFGEDAHEMRGGLPPLLASRPCSGTVPGNRRHVGTV